MKITERMLLHSTSFLDLLQVKYVDHLGVEKSWFGVTRTNALAAVCIAALTTNRELILVRQPRPMVGASTIELPAGLCDIPGESLEQTARRELLEETGFEAATVRKLIGGPNGLTESSGLTDERVYIYFAEGAYQVTKPLENEGTEPSLVPLDEAYEWLEQQVELGAEVDVKLFGIVRILEKETSREYL